jgi:ankyrin repeat protein
MEKYTWRTKVLAWGVVISLAFISGCRNSQPPGSSTTLASPVTGDEESQIVDEIDSALSPRADVNANGGAALEDAIQLQRLDFVNALLQKGANPNLKDQGGYTPLMHAAGDHHHEIIEELIKSGADVNCVSKPGQDLSVYTALSCGVQDATTVRILVAHGADCNLPNQPGCRPLDAAAKGGTPEVLSLLIAGGAGMRPQEAREAMDIAIGVDRVDNLKLLISKGADVDAIGASGLTLLTFWAGQTDRDDCIAAMIAGGANINAKDNYGNTPLSLATRNGQTAHENLLLAAGAKGK